MEGFRVWRGFHRRDDHGIGSSERFTGGINDWDGDEAIFHFSRHGLPATGVFAILLLAAAAIGAQGQGEG